MFLSLQSKILLWKVHFHIYFPQWQVMSKVVSSPESTLNNISNQMAKTSMTVVNGAKWDLE